MYKKGHMDKDIKPVTKWAKTLISQYAYKVGDSPVILQIINDSSTVQVLILFTDYCWFWYLKIISK